jgi:hypothetical protein
MFDVGIFVDNNRQQIAHTPRPQVSEQKSTIRMPPVP